MKIDQILTEFNRMASVVPPYNVAHHYYQPDDNQRSDSMIPSITISSLDTRNACHMEHLARSLTQYQLCRGTVILLLRIGKGVFRGKYRLYLSDPWYHGRIWRSGVNRLHEPTKSRTRYRITLGRVHSIGVRNGFGTGWEDLLPYSCRLA